MQRISLQQVFEWGILAILALIVIHAPLSVVGGIVLPAADEVLKSWKEILLVLLSVLGMILATRSKAWGSLLKSWPIRIALVFVILHLALAIVLGGDIRSVIAGLMIDLRFVVVFILSYLAAQLNPRFLGQAVKVVAGAACVVIGFGLLQITVLPDGFLRNIGYSSTTITPFTTIDSNPDYVRINSTLRGPNPLGALMVVYGALAAAYVVSGIRTGRTRRHLVAAGTTISAGAVLFASYSRSAYVAFLLAAAVVVGASLKLSKKLLTVAAALAILVGGGAIMLAETDWYSNVILHEDPESTVQTKSNAEHLVSLETGAQRLVAQPVGAGIGSTGSASLYDDTPANDTIIENYYFFVAHESGWLGFGLFIGLYALVLWGLWVRRRNWVALGLLASGTGLAVIGVLLPVWADETVALTWWALSGAMLAATSGIIKTNDTRTSK